MSVSLRESAFAVSKSTGQPVKMESEIVRMVSLCTAEISEITSYLQGPVTLNTS